MIFTRSKKVQKEYNKIKTTISNDSCFICDRELLVKEYNHWLLLENRYPYKEFKKHYLLCPKRHINRRGILTKEENEEYVGIMLKFSRKGYVWMWNPEEKSSFKYHRHCQVGKIKWYYKIKKWINN